MVESIPTLEWTLHKGVWTAKLDDGELQIRSAGLNGGWELWFYGKGAWGTNQFLGTHNSQLDARNYANVWVGDNTTATG